MARRVTIGASILVLGLVLLVVNSATAQLFIVNTLARSGAYDRHANVPYGRQPRQKLDIYVPRQHAGDRPTLIFIPGGCWGACETLPKDDYRFIADSFAVQGYGVVIINYRLYPDVMFPSIIDDARAAVAWVARYAQDYGISSRNLVLMGHSAGAHMATLLALDQRYLGPDLRSRIEGVVGLAGPYDFLPFTEPYEPALFGPEARYADSQPINFVDGTEPPMLLLYGEADTRVKPRNILQLTRRIEQRGGTVRDYCYPGIDHPGIIGALSRPLRDIQPVYADILQFLDQVRGGNVPPESRGGSCKSLQEPA